ncbi:hypothetical protein P3T23_005710 [Paraburkholderia sp. GAS448]
MIGRARINANDGHTLQWLTFVGTRCTYLRYRLARSGNITIYPYNLAISACRSASFRVVSYLKKKAPWRLFLHTNALKPGPTYGAFRFALSLAFSFASP